MEELERANDASTSTYEVVAHEEVAIPAIEKMPTFLRQIIEAFLVRTEPDSSIVNPAHIHITSTPHTKNENVLRMNWMSRVEREPDIVRLTA